MAALDIVKLVVAAALVVAGVAGYYLLADQMLIVRILSVIAGIGAGAAVAWFTAPGREFAAYSAESVKPAMRMRAVVSQPPSMSC